ncbi:peptide ABC transporter substrate-binding protein [Clostridiales bacterium COT073_COT-073]|nr:peptide ABC transporter substrate-binding protein [Clostridiales bacterium COT073_COT-073]
MKKFLSLFISLVLITTLLAGCGPKQGTSQTEEDTPKSNTTETTEAKEKTPEKEQTTQTPTTETTTAEQKIIFALHDVPDGIDPNVTNNSFATPFLSNCFEGLVSINEKNELAPALAEKWTISEDGKTYTFTLRDNLKWSDGSPLTSADFMYTMERILKPETTCQNVTMLTDYVVNALACYEGKVPFDQVGFKAPDEKTFVIELMDPASFYIDILSLFIYCPVQKATVEANGDKWTLSADTYVVNGPFKITKMNMNEAIVLTKNEHYWDAANVTLEEITFRMIKDQATALLAFDSKEIDGMRSVPMADFARLKAESNDLHIVPSYATSYYLLNNAQPPYDNVLVRKALNLAVDRNSLIENVLQGNAIPAYSLFAPGYIFNGKDFTEGRSNYGLSANANVEEAKKALAEAGYPNGEGFPTMKLSYYTSPQVKLIAEALAQMFKENLNINVEITNSEWAVYYAEVQAGKYEVAAMGVGADYLHPMSFAPVFISTEPTNDTGYGSKFYDEKIIAAKKELDPEKMLNLIREAEDILMEDYPFLPLYHRSSSLLMRDYVQGWTLSPTGNFCFKYAKVVK